MSRHVLVTGGLGFIGSALVARLVESDYEVTVFDDASRGDLGNIDGSRVRVVSGDLRDRAAVAECVGSADFTAVLHLAAMHFIPDCNRDPQSCIAVNVIGTENVLAACAEHGVDTVVGVSSMAVYPISDDAVSEDDPIGPYDVYGETKVANEMQLQRWSRGRDERVAVAIRLSNAYGPRETNPHVIPAILEQLRDGVTELDLGNTAPLRDYIHTEDVAAAFEAVLQAGLPTGYHVFNLGSGEERSVDDILGALQTILGIPIEKRVNPEKVRPVERMHLLPDIGRIAEVTGWTPAHSFVEGITKLVDWYGIPRPEASLRRDGAELAG